MQTIHVLMHNIRSAHNVGSIFRTADAAGVERIILSGYTPTPIDRFGRPQKDIAKTALGAESTIPWTYVKSPKTCIRDAKETGWRVVVVEQDARSIDYRAVPKDRPLLFVLGNEVRGVSKSIRDAADTIVEIPMHGNKESLNVSVAAGIVLFAVR
jgi:23S rRNA (guanosine2251-2'-O)-methyltransferase